MDKNNLKKSIENEIKIKINKEIERIVKEIKKCTETEIIDIDEITKNAYGFFVFFDTNEEFLSDLETEYEFKYKSSNKKLNMTNILQGTKSPPNSKQKKRIKGLKKNDHACHIIARCLGGKNSPRNNLFAGTKDLNIHLMLPVELLVRDAVNKSNKDIHYSVILAYKNSSDRCSDVYIKIELNNEKIFLKLKNESFSHILPTPLRKWWNIIEDSRNIIKDKKPMKP